MGMASSSTEECAGNSLDDPETDYGSDFSPEEEEILRALASGTQRADTEDNPIVTQLERHEEQTLRIPRAFGKEPRSALFEAAQTADDIAERIRATVENDRHSDCKFISA